jgi:hypothetical protein
MGWKRVLEINYRILARNNLWSSGLRHEWHHILVVPWYDSFGSLLLNTLGAIERWGLLLRFFFRASGKLVVFFKEKNPQSSVEQLATRSFRAGRLLVVSLAEEKSFEHVYYNF